MTTAFLVLCGLLVAALVVDLVLTAVDPHPTRRVRLKRVLVLLALAGATAVVGAPVLWGLLT